jgi:nucleotide-binding universal stress UspA family protein
MGSQSEEIVHHAQVPVLVLRAGEGVWPPKRIVVGEDFSDDARRAGNLAASIGGLYDAGGLLVYSHPDLPRYRPARRDRRYARWWICAIGTNSCCRSGPPS